jgi:hypothetical protein
MTFSFRIPDGLCSATGDGGGAIMVIAAVLPRTGGGQAVEIKASGTHMMREEGAEARKKLIYSLPGTYHLISSDEYMVEKHREAMLEDQ